MGGTRPSSGEVADGDGAAAAEGPGPGSGLVVTASVTPTTPALGRPGQSGGPPPPHPLSPQYLNPSCSPPPASARAEEPQVSERRGFGVVRGRGLGRRGRGLRGLGKK